MCALRSSQTHSFLMPLRVASLGSYTWRAAVRARGPVFAKMASVAPTARRVLVPVANGSEDIETSAIVDVFRRAKFEVDVASVGSASRVVKLARGMVLTADVTIEDASSRGCYDMIALPGGMPGAEHLRDDETLTRLLTEQHAARRYVAAICAAPAVVLVHHGILTPDVKATSHPNFVTKLPCQDSVSQRVVVDGHIITSRGPGTAIEFALQCVACLADRDTATAVAAPMVMPDDWHLV